MPMLLVKQGYKVGEKNTEANTNKIVMASSASFRSNHFYTTYTDWTKEMFKRGNDKYFTLTLPWKIGVQAGFMEESDIMEKKKELSAMQFAMEYEGVFPSLIDGTWINPEDLEACRNLTDFQLHGNNKFEYIMSVDIARMKGEDNTIIMVFKLKWVKEHIEPELVYIQSMNGCTFAEQAKQIRAVKRRYPSIIRAYMDAVTIGQGVFDELAKEFLCEETETYEDPWIDMNDEEALKNRELTHAIPLIYGIKATPEINHKCGYAVKKYIEKKWLHLYTRNAGEIAHVNKDTDYTYEEELVLNETRQTIDEVINMQAQTLNSGFMKFITRGKRKDRWSALGYGLYGVEIIQKEREKPKNEKAIFGFTRLNLNRRGGF